MKRRDLKSGMTLVLRDGSAFLYLKELGGLKNVIVGDGSWDSIKDNWDKHLLAESPDMDVMEVREPPSAAKFCQSIEGGIPYIGRLLWSREEAKGGTVPPFVLFEKGEMILARMTPCSVWAATFFLESGMGGHINCTADKEGTCTSQSFKFFQKFDINKIGTSEE